MNGGIAQLVERCLCKADASGSSPLTSTPRKVKNWSGEKKLLLGHDKLEKLATIQQSDLVPDIKAWLTPSADPH